MHFQIFIPGGDVEAADCADLLADPHSDQISDGPAGESYWPEVKMPDDVTLDDLPLPEWNLDGIRFDAPGLLFRNGSTFDRDRGIWYPATPEGDKPRGRYWIGCSIDHPPTPADLQRETVETFHAFEFGDGHTWKLPLCDQLTRDVRITDDGRWLYVPVAELSYVYGLARELKQRLAQAAYEPWTEAFDYGELVEFLITALRINYRLDQCVCSFLRLFFTNGRGENIVPAVMLATVGHPGGFTN